MMLRNVNQSNPSVRYQLDIFLVGPNMKLYLLYELGLFKYFNGGRYLDQPDQRGNAVGCTARDGDHAGDHAAAMWEAGLTAK